MNAKIIWKAAWSGIITGLILALFLKGVQAVTGRKVYTLLLNVDYIPVIKEFQFPEAAEVSFHLIISVILCLLLVILYKSSRGVIRKQFIWTSLLVNVFIGLLLYPTTSFSDRTPDTADMPALFWWIAGHALYGLLAGWMLKNWTVKKKPI
ncbi:hypothetical protein [Sporosarcina cascadiensis]|uniref:hypothetical protein n=1 Tax=Sporosarcina cascadiensis TaxID=2660747 RepID=UPI00129B1A91|nr:hypothetical protein [Sporosarcina cascadiensis]